MKNLLAGIVIGVALCGVVDAQIFARYYEPGQLMEDEDTSSYSRAVRLGYSTGVADTMTFIVRFMEKSSRTYEQDHMKLAEIEECLKFRGTTRGTLASFAADVWRPLVGQKESAAALLAVACLSKEQ